MSRLFVSYNRKSETAVRSLASDLGQLGHEVWFDQDLSGGQAWWDQILENVRNCEAFVFALAPESLNSTACDREYRYAEALGKPILPVLVAEGVSPNLLPPALSAIQLLDYRDQEDRGAALSLARAITTLPPAVPLPNPLPQPPEVPISYLGNLTEQIASSATLSLQEQIVLVGDLKRGLRDRDTADDARTLLERLRKRHDLYARAAEDIDELLAPLGKPPPPPPPVPTVLQSEPPPKPPKQTQPLVTTEATDDEEPLITAELAESKEPSDTIEAPDDEEPSITTEAADDEEPATVEEAPQQTPTDIEAPETREQVTPLDLPIRSFVMLFDRRRYGMNVYVGVGALVAYAVFKFGIIVVYGFQRSVVVLLAEILVFGVVEAAGFAFLCSTVRRDWLLPLLFGAFSALAGIIGRAVLGLLVGWHAPPHRFSAHYQRLLILRIVDGWSGLRGQVLWP